MTGCLAINIMLIAIHLKRLDLSNTIGYLALVARKCVSELLRIKCTC